MHKEGSLNCKSPQEILTLVEKLILACGIIYFSSILTEFSFTFSDFGFLSIKETVQGSHFLQSPSIFHVFPNEVFACVITILAIGYSILFCCGVVKRSWVAHLMNYSLCLSFLNIYQGNTFIWDRLFAQASLLYFLFNISKRETKERDCLTLGMRIILFQLFFQNGIVKFVSNYHSGWLDGSFLGQYFLNQPNPTYLSYLFSDLPKFFSISGTLFIFIVEMILPFCFFSKRKSPFVLSLVILSQVLFFIFGNFSIFNPLVIALSLSLLIECNIKSLLHFKKMNFFKAFVILTAFLGFIQILASLRPAMMNENLIFGTNWESQVSNKLRAPLRFFRNTCLSNFYSVFRNLPDEKYVLHLEFKYQSNWEKYFPSFVLSNPKKAPRHFAPYHPRFEHYFHYIANRSFYGSTIDNHYLLRLNKALINAHPKFLSELGIKSGYSHFKWVLNRFEKTNHHSKKDGFWKHVTVKEWAFKGVSTRRAF